MEFNIPANISNKRSLVVENNHTAEFFGSGAVKVLATPMMIALMENACLELVQSYLPDGWSTVGTHVDVEHLRPTPLGSEVHAEASLIEKKERSLLFSVTAYDSSGIIGKGSHKRYIINQDQFMERISDNAKSAHA